VYRGSDATPVLAVPEADYCLVGWYENEVLISTDQELCLLDLTEDHALTAVFDPLGLPVECPETMTVWIAAQLFEGSVQSGDWVGAFVDGELRGRAQFIAGTRGLVTAEITVNVNGEGELLSFRVWSVQSDTVHRCGGVEIYTAPAGEAGAQAEPVVLEEQRLVRFVLGQHGVRSGGGALEQTVPDATAATEPAVQAASGWTFIDWDTTFVCVTADLTVKARYEPDPPLWQLDLRVNGAEPATLTLGMALGATDGLDDGLDVQYPLPVAGQVCLASSALALSYSADYRPITDAAEFLLIACATEEEAIRVSWTAPALPGGKCLTLYEVLLESIAPSPAPVARTLVGNTALDMAVTQFLEIPAGETRCYVIRYGDDLVFDLPFVAGWNLVSLPFEPGDSAVAAVLGEELGRGGAAGDEVSRGSLGSRAVWALENGVYVAADRMQACTGYWVYATDPTVRLVTGTPVAQEGLALRQGWNICGTTMPCCLPASRGICSAIWLWNSERMCYEAPAALLPGRAYWFHATSSGVLDLTPR